ncbi:hypothetical protein MPSEU_000980400 [Mayamaea pseudoterrestris]|nr:hypothetical protein MPSEU_000980400 [Mayamaea pseudoterrestris]
MCKTSEELASMSKVEPKSTLVESVRHVQQPNGSIVGREVARIVLQQYDSLVSAIPSDLSSTAALASIDGRLPIDHGRIHSFVSDMGRQLHELGIGRKHRVAVILPNGPELALAILTISQWASCVPLNANGALSELEADCKRCRADVILGPCCSTTKSEEAMCGTAVIQEQARLFNVLQTEGYGTIDSFAGFCHVQKLANRLDIPFCGLAASKMEAGVFQLRPLSNPLLASEAQGMESRKGLLWSMLGGKDKPSAVSLEPTETSSLLSTTSSSSSLGSEENTSNDDKESRYAPNQHDDEVLVLFTSGTTGNKKLVAHRLGDMLVAAATIALSWNLSPLDVNCNMMPLYHVGGIVRQVFSPILSGGCVICCPAFEPTLFWALLRNRAFNWYYAAPTMHNMILQTGKELLAGDATVVTTLKPKLRMIANAAGGLLPALAKELRETFGANVLPSYGMTECMPISSPPSNYALEKPGTSGVPVGPEVAIIDPVTMRKYPADMEGPICVRGDPCFRGYSLNYLEPEGNVSSPFLADGWFDTGDLGYLDVDGWLFISGRSKEVINRGGELISPLEVEEAVTSHPRIQSCVAFSARHDILQEVVGVAVVPAPSMPRLSLDELHSFLSDRLENSKWPQCIVFMDDLPKSFTNKVLRLNLAQRLALPHFSDSMSSAEKIFEANCPRQGTPLDEHIKCKKLLAQASTVEAVLRRELLRDAAQKIIVVPHPMRAGCLVAHVHKIDRNELATVAKSLLDGFMVPSHICNMTSPEAFVNLPKPSDSIVAIAEGGFNGKVDSTELKVRQIMMDILDLDFISSKSNFFQLGGSSMLASQLASKIRKEFDVGFTGADVFQNNSVATMAELINDRTEGKGSHLAKEGYGVNEVGTNAPLAKLTADRLEPENNILKSAFQLMPICVVLPVWQLSRFFFYFMLLLQMLRSVPAAQSLLERFTLLEFDYYMTALVMTVISFHLTWIFVTPLLFVVLKWIVIGKYREGRYPLWSWYYLRWWFVDVVRKLVGRGIWGSSEVLLAFYYRLLGARIGRGARISLDAEIAEFDLVTIGRDAAIEYATLRPFGVDNGCMIMGTVSVGDRSSVGFRSVVAPFTEVPADTHLGPVTSSYEVSSAADPVHRRYNRHNLPAPSTISQFFIGGPIVLTVNILSSLPACFVLYLLVTMPFHYDISAGDLGDLMEWLCDARRIPFYIGIRVVRALVAPFVKIGAAIFIKKYIVGKFEPGCRGTTEWHLLRHWLMATLLSRQNIQEVTDLIGRHYELVSTLYRLLGAQVGKRVFWPGHQPIFSGEFDLIQIGDDVVFGSRSAIFCATTDSCEQVILSAGSNLSDNSILLPGSVLGKNVVLGSNSVGPAGWYLPEQSTWFGCRAGEPVLLERGVEGDFIPPLLAKTRKVSDFPFHGDATTLRPFGKAFYMKQAPYKVLSLGFIIIYSFACKAAIVTFHTFPVLAGIHGTAAIIYGWTPADRDFDSVDISAPRFYFTLLSVMIVSNLIRIVAWLAIEYFAKWFIIGQRQEGQYDYDKSDYCQRWELYQLLAKVRNFGRMNLMEFLAGTPFLVTYFRMLGCQIGKDCCLYPSGGDPYMPEVDLVEMGDGCVVDMASIVCHLNTGGHFELCKITMQDNTTLRCRSRIQQGVVMETGSMLLEKSLAMTGEVCDAASVWQGSPASRVHLYDRTTVTSFGSSDYGSTGAHQVNMSASAVHHAA